MFPPILARRLSKSPAILAEWLSAISSILAPLLVLSERDPIGSDSLAEVIFEVIVMPLVNAAGIDPVHFGLVVTLNLGIGQQTPPVASVLVTACSIAKADIWEVSKVNLYFIAVLAAMLLLVTYVPAVPMVLVGFFYR